MKKNILLLNGSTRIKGNSLNICSAIKNISESKESQVEIINIQLFLEKSIEELIEKIKSADIIGLVSPLYVDAFPYPVLDFLEKLELNCYDFLFEKDFFVIGQCNFPESRRIEPLIKSAECFCKKVNMRWLGGLSYGGAIRIESKELYKAGKEGKRLIKALESAMSEIISGQLISKKSKNLFRKDINKLLYKPFVWGANIMFKKVLN